MAPGAAGRRSGGDYGDGGMSDDVISLRNDKGIGGMPREFKRRKAGAPPSQPAVWTSPKVVEVGETPWGAFPKRFLVWATRQLYSDPREVLHVCSGGLAAGNGTRVDIRRAAAPDVVADGRSLPFRTGSFGAVLIDPPYSVEYARDLYGTDYPRPSHLLAEASRVVRPCGRVGIVHFLVPMPPKGCRLETVRALTTGCGYRIRAFTIFIREQDSLFVEGA